MNTLTKKSFGKVLALVMITALLCSMFMAIPANAADKGAWAPNTAYVAGDTVTYGGITYTCRQSHTSLTGWEPPNVPALWLEGGSAPSQVATPTFSPAGGTYTSAQNVTISCATSGATIRYTTNGSEPTSSSTQYTSAINVSSTTTIKAKAFKSGMTDSATASATYTISSVQTVAAPTFSPAGGTYTSAQNVTISCGTSGATIRYTTNGSEPTSSSTQYTSAINVSSTTTIKAKAFKSGMTDSATASATYTISSVTGVIFYQDADYGGTAVTLQPGSYTLAQMNAAGIPNDWTSSLKVPSGWTVDIYQDDNFAGTKWTFTANTSYVGAECNDKMSSVIISNSPVQTVATPTFNPPGGTYSSPQNVTISCATAGATIRYTLDGTTPTATSTAYTAPITIGSNMTIKAIALKAGMTNSNVATASYSFSGGNTTLPKRIMVGYWHTWNGGVPFIKLRDVNSNWDVINISFAEPVTPGSTDGRMKFVVSGLTSDYTTSDFKADIKTLQSRGKKVVLSIGGYEGYFSLTSTAAVNQFANDIKSFINEYGFDGIDIDLEQSSVQLNSGADPDFKNPTSPKVVNMISAIRSICNSYGSSFILSWAPETFYLQLGYQYYAGINPYVDSRAGSYIPMIYALRDKTTYVHAQLYNSGSILGLNGQSYSMGNTESIVAMCNMLLQGFNVNQNSSYFFPALRPDQVVIGVPASSSAAGSGQVTNQQLQQAFTTLNQSYPNLRGIMSWSINWDALQNNNSFASSNRAYLNTLP